MWCGIFYSCNLLLADRQEQIEQLEEVTSECYRAASTNNNYNNILISQSLCDVTNKSQVQQAIAHADEVATNATTTSKNISSVASILVNCAGITRDNKISNISNNDWDDVLDVNLKGTFLMCQSFCEPSRLNTLLLGDTIIDKNNPKKKKGTGGSIINIGSIVSSYGNVGQCNYAASKGGVVGLTRSLAKEMALFSWKATSTVDTIVGCSSNDVGEQQEDDTASLAPTVRVNCIQPGFIHTPMAHAVPEKVLNAMKQKIALRRLGTADDVANLALFLASTERSGYITGESFECSGMLRM